jgi:vacuole morphology and inheritance protein 14
VPPDAGADDESVAANDEKDVSSDDDWVPGQDVQVNHKEILEILTTNLDSQLGKSAIVCYLRIIIADSV